MKSALDRLVEEMRARSREVARISEKSEEARNRPKFALHADAVSDVWESAYRDLYTQLHPPAPAMPPYDPDPSLGEYIESGKKPEKKLAKKKAAKKRPSPRA